MAEHVTEQETRFNVLNHVNVPRHEVVPDADVKALLSKYRITRDQLPQIRANDAAIQPLFKALGVDESDRLGYVIRITRNSPTAGVAVAFRLVVEAL